MAKKFVVWDDVTKELGAASSFRRQWVRDFFDSPFWDNIPDKPFSTLGAEFEVSAGALEIAGIDAGKIISGVLDVARIPDLDASKITSGVFDLARIPNIDWSRISGNFPRDISDLISSAFSRSWISDFFGAPFWDNIPDKPFTNVSEFIADVSANKPSAGVVGRIFYELDTHLIWYDDGTEWVKMATADWEDMVNKPFNTLGGEFTVAAGELRIASIVRNKISDFFSSPFWDNIPDKPSVFPPEAHTHDISEISIPSLPDWTSEM